MEMKGFIEHSILSEDAEIYRDRVSYRERENITDIYTERHWVKFFFSFFLPDVVPELTERQRVGLKFIRVKGGVSSEAQ